MSRARALAFSGFAGNTVWLVGDAFMLGVIAPDAMGVALPRHNSGYVTSAEFWRNGSIYGVNRRLSFHSTPAPANIFFASGDAR